MKKHWVIIVSCVACAIVFFFAGMFYGKGTAGKASFAGGGYSLSARGGSFAGAARSGGGGFASGKVAAKDSRSITLQLPNGNSEVVFYSSSTQVSMPSTAPMSDVAIGANVMIGGTQNADGSLTAQSIQIRPAAGASSGSTAVSS